MTVWKPRLGGTRLSETFSVLLCRGLFVDHLISLNVIRFVESIVVVELLGKLITSAIGLSTFCFSGLRSKIAAVAIIFVDWMVFHASNCGIFLGEQVCGSVFTDGTRNNRRARWHGSKCGAQWNLTLWMIGHCCMFQFTHTDWAVCFSLRWERGGAVDEQVRSSTDVLAAVQIAACRRLSAGWVHLFGDNLRVYLHPALM